MEALPLLIFAGIVLSVVIVLANLELYGCLFGEDEPKRSKSITNKPWFRALIVPFIYIPGFSVIGLLVLLYMRAMKALDIN